jgi:hypothetical protein
MDNSNNRRMAHLRLPPTHPMEHDPMTETKKEQTTCEICGIMPATTHVRFTGYNLHICKQCDTSGRASEFYHLTREDI